jgi:alkylhydroperoxidase family enzyme
MKQPKRQRKVTDDKLRRAERLRALNYVATWGCSSEEWFMFRAAWPHILTHHTDVTSART